MSAAPPQNCRSRRRRISFARSSRRTRARDKYGGTSGHSLPAGAQRLSAYRTRQSRSASTSALPPRTAGPAICASTTRIRSRRTSNTRTRSRRRCAGSASTGEQHLYHASDYFDRLYEFARHFIKAGLAYVDSSTPRRCGACAEPDRGRTAEPVSRPAGRGESRPVPAHEGRRVSRRRARAAPEDRPRESEHQPARSRRSIASGTPRITAPATSGASIRSTTTRIASPTRSSASRIRSARSNSRITGRCTTG